MTQRPSATWSWQGRGRRWCRGSQLARGRGPGAPTLHSHPHQLPSGFHSVWGWDACRTCPLPLAHGAHSWFCRARGCCGQRRGVPHSRGCRHLCVSFMASENAGQNRATAVIWPRPRACLAADGDPASDVPVSSWSPEWPCPVSASGAEGSHVSGDRPGPGAAVAQSRGLPALQGAGLSARGALFPRTGKGPAVPPS